MSNNDPQAFEAQATPSTMDSYRYHDSDFVAWWLQGLYPFAPEDQIAIAEMLHDRINIPEVQDVIQDFVDSRKVGSVRAATPAAHFTTDVSVHRMTARETVVSSIIRSWKDQRSLYIMIFVICAVFAARGAWTIIRSVADLIP